MTFANVAEGAEAIHRGQRQLEVGVPCFGDAQRSVEGAGIKATTLEKRGREGLAERG